MMSPGNSACKATLKLMKITLRLNGQGKSELKTDFDLVMIESMSASLAHMFDAMGLTREKGMQCVSGYVGSGYIAPCLDLTKGESA